MNEVKVSDAMKAQLDQPAAALEEIVFLQPFPAGEFMEVARAQGHLRGLEEWLNTPEDDQSLLQ